MPAFSRESPAWLPYVGADGVRMGPSTADRALPNSFVRLISATVDLKCSGRIITALQWRRNERDGVSNHQPHDCLLNGLFGRRSKKTSNLRVTGLCEGNSPVTGEFPSQMASNAEKGFIWWRHHGSGRHICVPEDLLLQNTFVTAPEHFRNCPGTLS